MNSLNLGEFDCSQKNARLREMEGTCTYMKMVAREGDCLEGDPRKAAKSKIVRVRMVTRIFP